MIADCEELPIVPETYTLTFAVTGTVVIGNVTVVVPAGTVTVAGTVTFTFVDAKVTTSPVGPAGEVKLTVPVVDAPPRKEFGEIVTLCIEASFIVRFAARVIDWLDAAIDDTKVRDETGVVVIANVPDVEPPGIVSVAGTVAAALLEVSVATKPPVGAGPVSVTVPVEEFPPTSEVGERAMLVMNVPVTPSVVVWVAW